MIISKETDLWQTPKKLFNTLNDEFHFDYDVCQDGKNGLAPYLGDYLEIEYKDCVCFMNPPYSKPIIFVQRAIDLKKNNVKTVCLLKVDTSCKWFSLLWDYKNHKPKNNIEIRLLPKRVNFNHPTKTKSSNCFCSMIIVIKSDKD
jgi:phage N-6-adenine-methyltransferase